MSNSIVEIEDTKCVFIFGYNASTSHPIVARRINHAKAKGAKVIVCDPRKIETARIADIYAPLANGSNVAFLNAMMNVILEEGLQDQKFIDEHTENFDAFYETVKAYTPESTQHITGIEPEMLREIARTYAKAETATILWGMGVCQFRQGVETVRALASLAMLTGNLGKPNVGVNPVRGQNNVQGACDMGALFNTLPGYQSFADPEINAKFAKAWGVPSIPSKPGVPLSEVPEAIMEDKIKAFYIMGEDTLQTEPDINAVKKVPEAMAQKYNVIGYAFNDNVLTVATSDPLNYYGLEDVRLVSGCRISVSLATKADIQIAIERYYSDVDTLNLVDDIDESTLPEVEEDLNLFDANEDDTPVVKLLNSLLIRGYNTSASDIHIEPF